MKPLLTKQEIVDKVNSFVRPEFKDEDDGYIHCVKIIGEKVNRSGSSISLRVSFSIDDDNPLYTIHVGRPNSKEERVSHPVYDKCIAINLHLYFRILIKRGIYKRDKL